MLARQLQLQTLCPHASLPNRKEGAEAERLSSREDLVVPGTLLEVWEAGKGVSVRAG